MAGSWIVDAVRTPIGRHGGQLADVRPDDLAAAPLAALAARNPGLDPSTVDDVILGDANGAGEDNRNVARMASLLAGFPTTVPGTTVNRLCGSGLEAVVQAHRAIAIGDANVCIGGGVESMTRAPWVLMRPDHGHGRADATLHSTTLGWRMVNPRHPEQWTVSLGEGAEIIAGRKGLSRESQDGWALRSHQRASAAWTGGHFDDEVIAVPGFSCGGDESVREDAALSRLSALPPAFRPNGTVTAGNACPLSDGAAALLLASDEGVRRSAVRPMARIAATAVIGTDPHLFATGPVGAAAAALARAGLTWKDIDLVELNEAFAAQVLACLDEWPDLDPERVNVNGGAIALGHPLGCSGARILTTLVHELRRRKGRYGLAALCIGVGQGIAMVVESAT
ncbi:MAG: thiolase family protein [Acidimicrobiales bacterium]